MKRFVFWRRRLEGREGARGLSRASVTWTGVKEVRGVGMGLMVWEEGGTEFTRTAGPRFIAAWEGAMVDARRELFEGWLNHGLVWRS